VADGLTWHVYDDCTLKAFRSGQEVVALRFTPSQAVRVAADLIINAERMRRLERPANPDT
jgi:hypothetical protein